MEHPTMKSPTPTTDSMEAWRASAAEAWKMEQFYLNARTAPTADRSELRDDEPVPDHY